MSSTTKREVRHYDCCPEPYPNLQYQFVLQRKFRVTSEGLIWNPKLSQEQKGEKGPEDGHKFP